MESRQPVKAFLWGAGATVLTLFGGTLLGVLLGELVFAILPGHRIENPSPLNITLAAIPAVAGLMAGGAAWGLLMARFSRSGERRRAALAGLVGFAPTTFVLAFTLLSLEGPVAQAVEAWLPVHRLFTIVFTACAFLIAGISTWAVGRSLGGFDRPWRLALPVAAGAAAAFLAVDLTMEAAGWVVGAPRAGERATMVTVMFSGMLAAGLVGGGMLGWLLSQRALGDALTPTTANRPR